MKERFKQVVTILSDEAQYTFLSARYYANRVWRANERAILVNGSPKTGTTWMLKMLASLPGWHAVGNFQNDLGRYSNVQPGDVIHGHHPYSAELWEQLVAAHVKVVLMVRDPRDQLVSRMFHIRRETTHSWCTRFQLLTDDEALMACIEGRPDLPGAFAHLALTRSWLQENGKALLLKYESLHGATARELKRTLAYLDISLDDALVHSIVRRNSFERLSVGRKLWQKSRIQGQEDTTSHFRKGVVGDWRNYFTPDHLERLKEVAGEDMAKLGYPIEQWHPDQLLS